MERAILLTSADGDPASPRTWSGTPYRIMQELARLERLEGTHDSTPVPKSLRRLCHWSAHHLLGDPASYIFSPFTRAARVARLHRHLGSRDATVLHTGTLGMPLLRRPDNQRHYLFCDTTFHLAEAHSPIVKSLPPRARRIAAWLDRKSYRQMRHLFPIGEHVRQDLIHHYGLPPERVTAVGTGRGAFQPYAGPKDYAAGTILFVARQRFEEKGGALLLDAFERAVRINPRLRLTVVTQPEHHARARRIPNVTAHGFLSENDLQSLFEQAALFAMPAPYEPWGLVYLEALVCRTPILALARNAGPELCDHGRCGFLLDAPDDAGEPDPQRLAELLLDATATPERLARMGEWGQRRVQERYGWNLTVRRMLDVIDRDPGKTQAGSAGA